MPHKKKPPTKKKKLVCVAKGKHLARVMTILDPEDGHFEEDEADLPGSQLPRRHEDHETR